MFLAFVTMCFYEPPNFIICACDISVFCVAFLSFKLFGIFKFLKLIVLQYVLVFSDSFKNFILLHAEF